MYEELGLPGFAQVEPALRRYVASLVEYRKNSFRLSEPERAQVAARWRFAFAALGYSTGTEAEDTAREPALVSD